MTTPKAKALRDLDDVSITASQGFRAMVYFLRAFYDRTNATGTLPTLLSDIELQRDEGTSDPAALRDWERSVQAVRDEESTGRAR